MKTKTKTTKQLAKEYLNYWKKQLRLLDWKFTIKVVDKIEELSCFGITKQHPTDQSADIEVFDPEKIPEDWRGIRDLEVTIVHEILHTRLLYALGKKCDWHGESAIEIIATALVANRRGVNPEELE
jgi:hypothetical protein